MGKSPDTLDHKRYSVSVSSVSLKGRRIINVLLIVRNSLTIELSR